MKYKTTLSFGFSSFFLMLGISHGSMTDFAAVPPTQLTTVDPNVMINLSIETPMQGAAYNDQNNGGSCSGRPSSEGGQADSAPVIRPRRNSSVSSTRTSATRITEAISRRPAQPMRAINAPGNGVATF